MNKVKNCSIAGISFSVDAEAFEVLNDYIESLKRTYAKTEGGAEIIADLEARIAELILSVQDNKRVVELPLVKNIIQQLGTAEDLKDDTDSDLEPATPSIPRRLYREMQGAKLGGVCTGLGKYFDVDPVWIRLIAFLPVLLLIFVGGFWSSSLIFNFCIIELICYMIMWFTVPAARTARQRLEMEGQPITAKSVAGQTSIPSDADSKAKPIIANTVSVLGTILLTGLKIFAGLIVLILICVVCALTIGIFALFISNSAMVALPAVFAGVTVWAPVMVILVILTPIIILIYTLMCLIAARKPGRKTLFIFLIFWILEIFACGAIALKESPRFWKHNIHEMRIDWGYNNESSMDLEALTDQLDKLSESNEITVTVDKQEQTLKVATPEHSLTIRHDDKAGNEQKQK